MTYLANIPRVGLKEPARLPPEGRSARAYRDLPSQPAQHPGRSLMEGVGIVLVAALAAAVLLIALVVLFNAPAAAQLAGVA